MSSISKIIAKNSLFSLLGQVGVKALSLCRPVLVVRRLHSEDYFHRGIQLGHSECAGRGKC